MRTIEEGPAFSVEPEEGEPSLPSRGGDPTLLLAPADSSDAPKALIVEPAPPQHHPRKVTQGSPSTLQDEGSI